jgi:hypothetical protein
VDEAFGDGNDHGDFWEPSVDAARCTRRGVGAQLCGAVDTQCLLEPANETQHPDRRIGFDVAICVDPIVASQVTKGEGVLAEDLDETGWPSTGRRVQRSAVGRCQNHQARGGEKMTHTVIDVVDGLVHHGRSRRVEPVPDRPDRLIWKARLVGRLCVVVRAQRPSSVVARQ